MDLSQKRIVPRELFKFTTLLAEQSGKVLQGRMLVTLKETCDWVPLIVQERAVATLAI